MWFRRAETSREHVAVSAVSRQIPQEQLQVDTARGFTPREMGSGQRFGGFLYPAGAAGVARKQLSRRGPFLPARDTEMRRIFSVLASRVRPGRGQQPLYRSVDFKHMVVTAGH